MNDTFGKLQTPSQQFFELCRKQINQFETFFNSLAHIVGVKQSIVNLLQTCDLEFCCSENFCFEHRIFLLKLMMLILIRKHCKSRMESIKNEKKDKTASNKRWRSTLNYSDPYEYIYICIWNKIISK